MPHEQMDEQQVSAYLHMDLRKVVKLAARGQLPCRKVGGRFVFHKGEVEHWVEEQIHELPKERLADIEKGVTKHHGFEERSLLVWPLVTAGTLVVPMDARTGDAVLRKLVDHADKAGVVYGKEDLLKEVRAREELCSTAIAPGVALPHPRQPVPYDISCSFIVAGLTSSGVPFGAADGTLSRLFFLICCKDDRTHLHVLARLAQMLHNEVDLSNMISADDAGELGSIILECEKRVRLGA
jgi:nitrogen PTS system EIIA component